MSNESLRWTHQQLKEWRLCISINEPDRICCCRSGTGRILREYGHKGGRVLNLTP
jgi:hypothetical protein